MASTIAKKHTYYLISYNLVSFYCFLYILRYFSIIVPSGRSPTYFHCQVNILLTKHTNVNFTTLYLKKANFASRNIVHLLKNFTYVVPVSASILHFHLLNRLDH